MQDILRAYEMNADKASVDSNEEEDGAGHCNELLGELELRKVSIMRRMAKKWADPTQLREEVHRLGRTAEVEGSDGSPRHQHAKLKNLRWSLKKSDELHTSTSGQHLWVDVDEARCPTRIHIPDWLMRLRGYSRDLDWSVDNFKAHPGPLLLAIKDKMAAKFEYRGGLGDMPEAVFF